MNCDHIAAVYRWVEYAVFGRALERRRIRFLPLLGEFRRALVLGDGDGRFLQCLLDTNPSVRVDAVDNSGKMLALARGRAGAAGKQRVCFSCSDARSLNLNGAAYDLIVTHFFLDCFAQRDADLLIERLAAGALPRAGWVVSDFREPERGWRKALGKLTIRFLYFCFRMTTGLRVTRLPEHRDALRRYGFHLEQTEEAFGGMLVSELWRRG